MKLRFYFQILKMSKTQHENYIWKIQGRTIQTINDSSTRPMMGIAEGIFNSLQFSFKDSDVLDLFAGSGSMGMRL